VERWLPRLLEPASERLHPLGLAHAARQRAQRRHELAEHDRLGLRRGELLKVALQVAAGILIAVTVLFVIAVVWTLVIR
jgi:hypothetical protein